MDRKYLVTKKCEVVGCDKILEDVYPNRKFCNQCSRKRSQANRTPNLDKHARGKGW